MHVVDAHLRQQRGVNVVDRGAVFRGMIAELVGRPVGEARFEAAADKPHGKAGQVMVSSAALGHRRATELGAEDDDRVVEHAPLLEIDDQSRCPPIDLGRRPLDVLF